jgi:histidyl-tRNA synthetase
LVRLEVLEEILRNFGILEFCKFDFHVVRGLAYYTGIVFEANDRRGKLRAIMGGGRYDNLLAGVGGSSLPAAGFGMGDVVLMELLDGLGRVRPTRLGGGVYVVTAPDREKRDDAPVIPSDALGLVATLRRAGYRAEYSLQPQAVGKQLSRAAEWGAAYAVIVGEETRSRQVVQLKDMATGQQREVPLSRLLDRPGEFLGPAP